MLNNRKCGQYVCICDHIHIRHIITGNNFIAVEMIVKLYMPKFKNKKNVYLDL